MDYIVDLQGVLHSNIPGGSALYAAGGLKCWESRVGVVSKIQQDSSNEIFRYLAKYDLNSDGIIVDNIPFDHRNFLGYISEDEYKDENPVAFFASMGLPFPKSLEGYEKKDHSAEEGDAKDRYKILIARSLPIYTDAKAVHLCAFDLKTHIQLLSLIEKESPKTITLQPKKEYMNASNWESLPVLLKGLSAFIPTESQLLSLFKNRSQDLWEIAEYLCTLGCDSIVINNGHHGQYLYDGASKKRYQIPAYPAPLVDPTGMKDSFCGGFLAGLRRNYDSLEAVLFGNIAASFTGSGVGPFLVVNSLPGLAESRLKSLQGMVKCL
ncbi:MAG: carbohydrate kinase family protein [Chloroflexi bacterium]|nr:carbohydrate kinase family protein [Chloroflexota bacterium]